MWARAVALLLVGIAGTSHAQDAARWVVVSAVSTGDSDQSAHALAELARTELLRGDELVITDEEAAARLEHLTPVVMQALPPSLPALIGETAESALEDVAFGRDAAALERVTSTLMLVEPHLAAVGRLPELARDVDDLCLFGVRALLQQGDAPGASTWAEHCLWMSPHLEADAAMHPPPVIALITSIRARLAAGEGGILAVRTADGDPSHCVVRVQGRVAGASPMTRMVLVPGRYQVQVECEDGAVGRVYTVDVPAADPVRLRVEVRFADVLSSRSGLALRYATDDELMDRLQHDVGVLAAGVLAERVLVVRSVGGRTTLEAYEVRGRDARRYDWSVVEEPVLETCPAALRAALDGEQPVSTSEAMSGATVESRGRPPPAPTSSFDLVIGAALLSVGVAAFGVAWYFWGDLESRGNSIRYAHTPAELARSQVAFDSGAPPVWVLGAAAGGASLAALAMLLPPADDVPWWSLLVGAAGVGVGAVGIWQLASTGDCYANSALAVPCSRRTDTVTLGALILAHASVLIGVPLIHLFRLALGPTAAASVSLSDTELGVGARMLF